VLGRVLLLLLRVEGLLTDTGTGRGKGWDLLGGDRPGTLVCGEREGGGEERREKGRVGGEEIEERRVRR
jgi:hypothetical protein